MLRKISLLGELVFSAGPVDRVPYLSSAKSGLAQQVDIVAALDIARELP